MFKYFTLIFNSDKNNLNSVFMQGALSLEWVWSEHTGAYTGGGSSPLAPPGIYVHRLKSGVVGKKWACPHLQRGIFPFKK